MLQNPEFRVNIQSHDERKGDRGLQRVAFHAGPNGIDISPEGYGDMTSEDGMGCPVYLEVHPEDGLRLLVWADINQENPTHIIPLEGAKESARE